MFDVSKKKKNPYLKYIKLIYEARLDINNN